MELRGTTFILIITSYILQITSYNIKLFLHILEHFIDTELFITNKPF